ncbi:MAG: phosphodiester glycosidase family protein [Clostridia bacterium]|nr:phosphodiester glycosidase family protein [Clostridia bacterium]
MEQKKKKKKLLWVLLPVALLLAAGAVFCIMYFPAENAYRNAMQNSATLPYDAARASLESAIGTLHGNPLFTGKREALIGRLDELVYKHAMEECGTLPYADSSALLKDALETLNGKPDETAALTERLGEITGVEIRRAIDADETEYAIGLLKDVGSDRADTYRGMIYDKADAKLADGDMEGALNAFLLLDTYSDAPARVKEIRAEMRFADAAAVFTGNNYDEGIAALLALGTEQGDAAAAALEADRAARMQETRDFASGAIAAGAWHTAWLDGGAVRISGDARFETPDASAEKIFSGLGSVFGLSGGRVIAFGETFGSADAIAALENVTDMGIGLTHAVFLRDDGTVTGAGSEAFGRLNVSEWTGIADVAAGAWHSVGCTKDGAVLALGDNSFGQCDVQDWSGVVKVSAGLWHTAGLRSDGTVLAAGDNSFGQCDVRDWTDVISVECGANFTLGLRSDGTVLAAGDNAAGQCDVQNWTGVAAVSAGAYHTVAARMDGTLLSAGCVPHGALPETPVFDADWPVEPIEAFSARSSVERTAYVEGADRELGPWLYLDPNGAVLICIDDSLARPLFRVDMLATENALPEGRVTQPEATGNIIRMTTEMVEAQAQKAHAVVAFTGDYIGFTSNRKAVMIRNGIVYYDRAETSTMAIMPDGTIAYFEKEKTSAEALLQQGVKDSFSFGPLLVEDGKSQITDDTPNAKSITMRVALGYTDPYHYVTVVTLRDRKLQYSHRMTADVLVGYGVKLAYNLDGGHSACLAFMGKELSLVSLSGENNHSIRSLSDIIMFLENDSVQPTAEETP